MGQAKIADFGIARLNGTSLTQGGAMLGTPAYMAPEQVNGEAVDRRADLFAVGAILYETFAGRPPFVGRTMAETLVRLSGPAPADMAPIEAAGAAALVPVLRLALAKRPAERFQSVDEFAAALVGATTPRGSASTASMAATVVPGIGETMARRWDPALLQRLERQLTQFLGPIARVTVARAADRSADPDQLYATIADSLRNAEDRTAFLRGLGASSRQTLAGTQRLTQAATKPPTLPGQAAPISPEAVTAAQAVLAHFVGPIARMMVREASTQAISGRDFLDRLAAHVTRPDEVSELRRRLRAEVEPKLTV